MEFVRYTFCVLDVFEGSKLLGEVSPQCSFEDFGFRLPLIPSQLTIPSLEFVQWKIHSRYSHTGCSIQDQGKLEQASFEAMFSTTSERVVPLVEDFPTKSSFALIVSRLNFEEVQLARFPNLSRVVS
jgi:hypothetical protein